MTCSGLQRGGFYNSEPDQLFESLPSIILYPRRSLEFEILILIKPIIPRIMKNLLGLRVIINGPLTWPKTFPPNKS